MAGKSRDLEKCFEESQETGTLSIARRNMKEFPKSMENFDLADVVRADLSQNKFNELPRELSDSFMLECLNCAFNYLKSIPDLSHIHSLNHLNLSHNQIPVLPVHICSLPLKVLIMNHNKLHAVPSEIGLLGKLQKLDLSCNELTNLPSTMGEMVSLRTLKVRRNQLISLPDEVSKLKNLVHMDITSNKISIIPPAFRLITSLVVFELKDNPLTSPPAQICLKGRMHVFKYLSLAAQQQEKTWSLERDSRRMTKRTPSSSSISSNSLVESDLKLNHIDENGKMADGVDVVDNRDQNQSEDFGFLEADENRQLNDEQPKKSFEDTRNLERRILKDHELLQQKMRQQERPKQIKPSKPKTATLMRNQEKPMQAGHSTMSLDRASVRKYGGKMKSYNNDLETPHENEGPINDIAERKEQLLRLRQEALITKQKLEKIRSESEFSQGNIELTHPAEMSPRARTASHENTNSTQDQPIFEGIKKRSSIGKNKTVKALKEGHSTYTMRRIFDSAKEEFQQLEELRDAIESRLRISLPDDLPAALADGVVLCHLVNHVRKSTIQVIHVPSAGMPKLTMPKCSMNVDAFLEGCRKLGVEKVNLCSPPDILEEKNPNKVCKTVQALLHATSATNL
ncbi:DISP complex protein LRCH3-like isoform X2 [Rhopilema esculentum]|uniref:DISP complex protein LRCH3-like isoform X2 n=1 Tax=Rhopilema esculentum TaxID=499914 RepID=UPI0031CDB37F